MSIRYSLQLPHPLRQLSLPEIPHVHNPLLAEIQFLHIRRILLRGFGDATGDDDGVGFQDDAVVDDLVDAEGDQVVVLYQSAFVGGVSVIAYRVSVDRLSLCVVWDSSS